MVAALAGCPLCAESLNRLDVACALVEQAVRGAYRTGVRELPAAVAGVVGVLGVEVEIGDEAGPGTPAFLAQLDQAKAGAAAAVRAACPCASAG
jgi:hypothetical protein